MKKKKLIFILPEYDPHTATHFKYTLELAEAIAERMDVTLLIEKANGIPPTKHIARTVVLKAKNPGLSVLERCWVLAKLRLKGYRRVYIHYSYLTGLIAIILMKLTGGKSWYWHCEQRTLFEEKWGWNLEAIKKKITVDLPFRIILKSVTTLITCTETMKQYYHEALNVPLKKVEVVHNWIDVAAVKRHAATPHRELFEKWNIDPARKIILFVHWLSPRKGSRVLPLLIKKMLDQRKDVHFLVVGAGPDEDFLKKFVNDHSFESRVTLTSDVPNEQLPNYFSIADVFIVPSQNEEFGRVNIEAMAMGVPLVATQTLATEALFTSLQKKYTAPVGDVEGLAQAIQEILDHPERAKTLIEEGFKRVQNYDKLPNVNKFLTLFNA